MIGLDDTQVARMRADAEALLAQSATIRRRPAPSAAFATVADEVPCLLQMLTAREGQRVSDAGAEVDANCQLLVAVGVDVRRLDRLTVEGRVFEARIEAPRSVAVQRWLGRVEA